MTRNAASIVLVLGPVAAVPAWSAAAQPPATPNNTTPVAPASPVGTQPLPSDAAAVGPFLAAPNRPELSALDLATLDGQCQQALQREPNNPAYLYSSVMINRTRGRAQPALDLAKRLVELEPNRADYQFIYGALEFETINDAGTLTAASKAGRGRDAFLKTIELDPRHIEARIGLFQFYSQAPWIAGGSTSKARRMAEELLGVPGGGGEYQGRVLLGRLAAQDDEWAEADKQFALAEGAGGLGSGRLNALTSYAVILIEQKKDFAAAAKLADRAAAIDPEHTQVLYIRGRIAAHDKDHAAAAALFAKVVEKNPQARNSRFMLAEALEALGRKPEAAAAYAEFAARFPGDDRAKRASEAAVRLRG